MNDRDCDNCAHHSEGGCSVWECSFAQKDDTISRQAAIDVLTFGKEILSRAMDAMNVVGPDREKYSWGIRLIESDIEDINELPPAEPEIIRCKDCKHQVKEWRDDKRLKDKGYWVYGCKVISDICGYWAWFGQDDEFCSEAERRTDV